MGSFELPNGHAACSRRWSASTSTPESRCRRRSLRAGAVSVCPQPQFATSWRNSKSTATCTSRIPRLAECPPIADTAPSWTCCSKAGRPVVAHVNVEQELRRQQVQIAAHGRPACRVSHLVSRAARHVGFAFSADAGGSAAADRVRTSRWLADPRRRGGAKQSGHAEGR